MRRGGNNRTSSLSIALPIIIAVIILVVLVKAISGIGNSENSTSNPPNAGNFASILPKAEAKINIFMSSDTKNAITGPSKLFPTDKMVQVESGDADIEVEGSTMKLAIEALSELKYDGAMSDKQTFTLQNGYLWAESPNGDTELILKSFKASLAPGSVIIASQNVRASNIYVLKGSVNITTEGGTATVSFNQMLSLLQSEIKSSNLAEKVAPLDDFIKQSNMFTKKNGASILGESGSATETASGSSLSGSSITTSSSKAITFVYPEDEMIVDSATISVEGRLNRVGITKVLISGKEAKISSADSSFILKDLVLTQAVNDIDYKVYDDAGVVIEKGLLTVNFSGKKAVIKKPDVVSYPVSSKDFKIISPADNPHKTTDTAVKIRGSFAADLVKYIRVNNYQLQQFKQFGTSWVYNASIENGNMEEGVNEYLITYYGPNDEVLHTSKLYIVKEKPIEAVVPAPVTPETTPTSTGAVVPSL